MAKPWSTWLPDLLPQLPECPTPIIEHETRRAAQVFFEGSRAWKVRLPVIAVTAGNGSVAVLTSDVEQDLVRINQAWLDGNKLEPITGDTLSEEFGDDWKEHTGTPKCFLQDEAGYIQLYPVPIVDSVLSLRACVKPSDVATGLPNDLAVDYRSAITMGAKAQLMMYSGKPWTNPDLGLKNEAEFNAQINRVNAVVATGSARIPARPRWC